MPRKRKDVHDYVDLDTSVNDAATEELLTKLRRMIIGQDEAVSAIADAYQMHKAGLNAPGRPLGNFLFLGPTGTGKTRTVEALAECLVGNPRAIIKIDCAEFQHSHDIAKLIGSPPGYLGHRETQPALSQPRLNQHHTDECKISFVLFDEIEKASDALWNLLLGILDKATLTLGDNTRVDFSRCLIFMTSNIGAKDMQAMNAPKLGFQGVAASPLTIDDKMEKLGVEAARKKFTPEFFNRLDRVVVYKPLGPAELQHILDLELDQVARRISLSALSLAFTFAVTDDAAPFCLKRGPIPGMGPDI